MSKKRIILILVVVFISAVILFGYIKAEYKQKQEIKKPENHAILLKSLDESHPLYTINDKIFSRNTTCINFKHFEYMDDSGYPIIPEFAWIDKVILPEYSTEEVYWVRMPGWKYEGYAEIVEGDSEVPIYQDKIHFGKDGDKYIYHGAPGLGWFYYYCTKKSQQVDENGKLLHPDRFLVDRVEWILSGGSEEDRIIMWAVVYNDNSDRIKYVYRVAPWRKEIPETFTATNKDEYFEYIWDDKVNEVTIHHYKYDTSKPIHIWKTKINELH